MVIDELQLGDSLSAIRVMSDGSVDLVVTDIPYNECNRDDNGLRNLDKEGADVGDFDVSELTRDLCRVSKGSVYMFCGINQVSDIRRAMTASGLSTRVIVWEKLNPSPMNGQSIWLSGIELCVYGKKPGAVFNYHCRNSVLRHPSGKSSTHPTEKPERLIRELVLASSNKGDLVFDPFMGSGTTAVVCLQEGRHFIGYELDEKYYAEACKRIELAKQDQRRALFAD